MYDDNVDQFGGWAGSGDTVGITGGSLQVFKDGETFDIFDGPGDPLVSFDVDNPDGLRVWVAGELVWTSRKGLV